MRAVGFVLGAVVSAVEAVVKNVASLVEPGRAADLLEDVVAVLTATSRYCDVTTDSGFAACECAEGVCAVARVEAVEDVPASCGMANVVPGVFRPAPSVAGLPVRGVLLLLAAGLSCSAPGIWVVALEMTLRGAEVDVGDNTEPELLFPDLSVVVTSSVTWLEVEAGTLPEVAEEAVDGTASVWSREPPEASEALAVEFVLVRTTAMPPVTAVAVAVLALVVVALLAIVLLSFVSKCVSPVSSKCLR